MSLSKVIEIFIGVYLISVVIGFSIVMIAKHERAEETKHEVILICIYDGGNK